MATSAQKELFLFDGKSAKPLKVGQENTLKIKAGDHYRIVGDAAGKDRNPVKAIAKAKGKDLLVECEDGTRITLVDYMNECRDGVCDLILPGDEYPVAMGELQGASQASAAAVTGDAGTQAAASVAKTASDGNGMLLGLGGAALVGLALGLGGGAQAHARFLQLRLGLALAKLLDEQQLVNHFHGA